MKNNLQNAEINMVRSQVFTNKVTDEAVMAVMESVPRDEFVPSNYRGVACVDEDLPLGNGRYLIEPMVFARLLQLAEIKKTDSVLVIAPASGYPLAVIAQLAGKVIGVESDAVDVTAVPEKLARLNLHNVTLVSGNLHLGHPALKPYDVIFINGAVQKIPEALTDQLKNNGRLITVQADVENEKAPGYGVVAHKLGKTISEAKIFQAFTPRLKEFDLPRKFAF